VVSELPSGTVTFLFTDLEGSTRLWEEHPDAMRRALARHDALVRAAVGAHGGVVVKGTGDGVHAAFATAHDALGAAIAAQQAMGSEGWEEDVPLRVRMGVHSGEAELRDGDYFGMALNRAARLMGVAYGGQIVCSQATADLARDSLSGRVTLVDLGEHRLRDLGRPERVFQVGAPGLRAEFPALVSLNAFPGNLAPTASSFVGRDQELAEVREGVAASRLVTLVGVGGVGKTRLAIEAAVDLVGQYPDGVWLCELAGADDEPSMHQLVAASLGVVSRPGLDLRDSVVEFLAPKQLVVVLDNCEHLIDAAAELAHVVTVRCPRVRVLATSREALALNGERVVRVGSLSLPERDATAAGSAGDAVRLFVERAADARPGFHVDDSNVEVIVELCRRLDGMPLALELAAARVASMTPVEISSHLDERFRLLAGRRRATVERHQTLRATVDWSYSLLDDTERRVFDRLGVFAGSFSADAAVAVCADGLESWDVLDGLATLTAKSLLVADATGDGATRYRMLETMRHYARERLAGDDDPDRWRSRHAEYYAELAREIGEALLGPDELAWRPRLAWELDDLRSAMNWSLDRPRDERCVRIIAALSVQAAHFDAAGIGTWAMQCRERAEEAAPGLRCAVLGAAAWEVYRQGDPDAIVLGEAALRDGLPPGWPSSYLPHLALAAARGTQRSIHEAEAIATAGHAALDAAGVTPNGHVHLHTIQATVDDDPDQRREHGEAALDLARKSGNPTALAVGWFALGMSCADDEPERALAALQESIALVHQGAGDGIFPTAPAAAATVAARLGHREQALTNLREALLHGRDRSHRMGIGTCAVAAAGVFADLDRPIITATLAGALTDPVSFGVLDLSHQVAQEARIEEVRASTPPDDYEQAFARGAAMSYDEVVQYLLDETQHVPSDTSPDGTTRVQADAAPNGRF
jgi:predicted ATPase/class 3 adenylate cyclase